MGYAIPSISRLKGGKAMTSAYHHNFRVVHPLNADITKTHMNREIVDELYGRTYEDAYRDMMNNLYMEGAYRRTPRKDAVHGLEVLLTMSREDVGRIDIDEWVNTNVEWLRSYFNPPDNKITFTDPDTGEQKVLEQDNVVSVVLHMDEAVPHLHAIVIPVDERGHLNADKIVGGKSELRAMHDDYAKAMERFGLERGERFTTAHQEKMRAFYAKLEKAVDAVLPPPLPGESMEAYYLRAQEAYQTLSAQSRDKELKIIQAAKREHAEATTEKMEAEAMRRDFAQRTEKVAKELGVPDLLSDEAIGKLRRIVQDHERFEYALEHNPDKERAAQALQRYEEMIRWASRHNKRNKDRDLFTKAQ